MSISGVKITAAELESGVATVRAALKTIPTSPGVYRMLDAKGAVLYVGKALNLKNRVTSYTRATQLRERLMRMVSMTRQMEIVTTASEADALLLEANYIKRMKPRFNILLRDDKSYPWIMLSGNHPFPQVSKQRGKPKKDVTYWGPFASAWSVNQTLNLIQKSFLLRPCSDSEMATRTRPCLLYQIKRCSAPCVDRIAQDDYRALVDEVRQFLSGKSTHLRETLATEMAEAAEAQDYERAAMIRDRIRAFSGLQDSSVINPASLHDADIFAIWQDADQCCVEVFFIRAGRNNGNRALFPAQTDEESGEDILSAFLLQFYDSKPPPELILLNQPLSEPALVASALSKAAGHRVEIMVPQRGEKRSVVLHAEQNAREALGRRLAESAGTQHLLSETARVFHLETPPERIEVYDNSHISGRHAYGVMIVGGPEGFHRRDYRKFSIKSVLTPGDDYAMMREVMERRFRKTNDAEANRKYARMPDILLIDGGQGQYNIVKKVLDELGVEGVKLVSIAKGPNRDAGREWFFTDDQPPFQLPEKDPVLYYLQRLRDEAHRFAITTHRASRSGAIRKSELDRIEGIGPVRKKALLAHFGSARAVKQAGLTELTQAKGINMEMARLVFSHFHPDTEI
ncbi:MAG: excinuclease ABC subunit UvrC [Acetobacteraceae bacterium]